jgi:hypothetical protein
MKENEVEVVVAARKNFESSMFYMKVVAHIETRVM